MKSKKVGEVSIGLQILRFLAMVFLTLFTAVMIVINRDLVGRGYMIFLFILLIFFAVGTIFVFFSTSKLIKENEDQSQD